MFFEQLLLHNQDEEVQQCRQLLVTASPILCGAIKRSFDGMNATFGIMSTGSSSTSNAEDDSIQRIVPLHECTTFPIIAPYFSFLEMLNASMVQPFLPLLKNSQSAVSLLVDFEKFECFYYSRFSKSITSALDADTIYTEIMSCIKGSLEALHSDSGHISEEQYCSLEGSRDSNLDCEHRKLIYGAYLRYERLKCRDYNEFDILDAVYHIYHGLKRPRLPLFQSIFIDEVQDLTPAQLALFKHVGHNNKGFVFAGDTAQTVSFNAIQFIFSFEFASFRLRTGLASDLKLSSQFFTKNFSVILKIQH
jgi:hypothetical protein